MMEIGISLDGTTGKVYGEKIDTVTATVSGNFAMLYELGR